MTEMQELTKRIEAIEAEQGRQHNELTNMIAQQAQAARCPECGWTSCVHQQAAPVEACNGGRDVVCPRCDMVFAVRQPAPQTCEEHKPLKIDGKEIPQNVAPLQCPICNHVYRNKDVMAWLDICKPARASEPTGGDGQ